MALTTGAFTAAAPTSGSSQASTSSHGDPALAHAPSQVHTGSCAITTIWSGFSHAFKNRRLS
jgi:hypothetical protein